MQTIERQGLWQNRWLWLVVPFVLVALGASLWAAATDRSSPWGAVLGIVVLAFVASMHLRTQIDGTSLRITFFPIARRTIPLDAIRSARVITYRPVRDFGGWGIRWGRGATAFTVAGRQGVRLELEGRDFVVGSQTPKVLLAELEMRGITVDDGN